MATETIKSTYSLDVDTVRALEKLARRWNVSKSEALRRVIRASAAQAPRDAGHDALRALDDLQRALDLTTGAAARWSTGARTERRSASRRREPGGR
ncbi:MAG TPA: ribbon-helix-helix protein, CopG family [Burkholderiales bacterium]|nr:ribbon-helix-helix protein, CopG family [Burkholderiales bacterium]